jgi:hypothetical protein
MANTKISALTSATTPLAGTETLPVVQSSATTKVTVANLTAGRAVSALSFASTTGSAFASTSGNVGIGSLVTTEAKLKIATTNGASDFSSSGINICGAAEITSGQVLPISFTPIGNDSTRARAGIACEVGTNWGYGSIGIYARGAADGSLLTTADRKMLVSYTGDVTVDTGNLVIGTSGKGIDFSATPGTGTSELLADYEEGTWTPTNPQVSLTVTSAVYTKIGRCVNFQCRVAWPANADTNQASILGLPFTPSGQDYPVTVFSNSGAGASAYIPGSAVINLYTINQSAIYTNAQLAGLTLRITGFYFV